MKKNYKTKFCLFTLVLCATVKLSAQQTYTFTNCGATGSIGPTPTQVNATYSTTNLNGQVGAITNGIQTWTVPSSGNYRIEARGAQGGATATAVGALGATMIGDFSLTGGEVLRILVGQMGDDGGTGPGGGGGGSFVVRTPYTTTTAILIIAGGGSGNGNYGIAPGLTTTAGGMGGVAGGTNGTGGLGGIRGAGGGGFLTNGDPCTANTAYATPGQAFINGGLGGQRTNHTCGFTASGGFGGGSSHGGNCINNGGAGGGFSGGGGSSNTTSGGGGSFNAATSQTNTAGSNTGQGLVLIKELCSISLFAASANSLTPLICNGQSLTLNTNAISNYSWSTGATTSSIVVSPTSTTVYTLTGTSPSNCNAAATITVNVSSALPTLTVTNSTSGNNSGVCPNGTLALTASGAVTYTWSGSVTNGVSFTTAVASGYTVTGENGCGTTSAATSVSIHPTPTLSAISVANPTMCSGTTNTLTVSGTGVSTYSWSTSSTASFITVSPSATTNYTVKGTSAVGCTNTAAAAVTVVATPVQVPVASPAVFCVGGSSTLTAVAPSFTWLPGGTNTSSIVVTPTTNGVYTFTVIKANGVCSDTKTLSITVNAVPVISAQALPTIVCQSAQTATLSGSGGTSYTWAPAGGNASTALVTASANTTYTLTGSNGNCQSTTTINLAVNLNPTIAIVASSSVICINQSATLTATGGTSYSWTPSTITGPTAIVSPTIATAYSVIGYDNNGCSGNASQVVVATPQPTLVLGTSSPTICNGNSASLTASGAQVYTWSNGPTGTINVVNPGQTTTYTVIGTNTVTTCSETKTIDVVVFDPVVTVTGNTVICSEGFANLMANGATTYTWNPGGIPFQSVSLSPPSTVVYTVSATSSSNNVICLVSGTVQILVNPNPTITSISAKPAICAKETNTYTASGASTYTWASTNTTVVGPSIQVSSPNVAILVYTVTGTSALGCESSVIIPVSIFACTGIEHPDSYREADGHKLLSVYPNPSNGEFNLQGNSEMNLNLVNELGQLIQVFKLNENNNYKVSVSGLSSGIYFLVGENVKQKIIVNK